MSDIFDITNYLNHKLIDYTMTDENNRLFLDINIDESLKKNFKIMCIQKNIDMKQRVFDLIESDVVEYFNE